VGAQRIGFDNEKYLREQQEEILRRVERFQDRLYLEFGGKLIFDYHAARVLPGYDPNVKMRLLSSLADKSDIVLCIYAGDIERRRIRGDFGITYDSDALKMIDDLGRWNVTVRAVVITRFEGQESAQKFRNRLERRGLRVYTHRFTKGYPTDVDTIVSDEGYGANEYIQTDKQIVVVTGPGPSSGKLATCLSQLYHEYKRGARAGYAKFETFPIWNLPLAHPVNVAYEAATADIGDFNAIDSFHLEATNEKAINYNRDLEVFPVLKRIMERISGEKSVYRSPTEMGVNRAGFSIVDDAAVREAAVQEVIRRYFRYSCEHAMGIEERKTVQRVELLMKDLEVGPGDRKVVTAAGCAAREAQAKGKGNQGVYCGAALELKDGTIVTGKNSALMHAASSLVLNAVKHLAGIPDSIHLLAPHITTTLSHFKKDILGSRVVSLDLEETLIALSISAPMNPTAQAAVERLAELRGCEAHITHIPTPGDEAGLRKLGVNLTCDPNFASKDLFVD
jgi:uncharacterized protein (UPF0371 family)